LTLYINANVLILLLNFVKFEEISKYKMSQNNWNNEPSNQDNWWSQPNHNETGWSQTTWALENQSQDKARTFDHTLESSSSSTLTPARSQSQSSGGATLTQASNSKFCYFIIKSLFSKFSKAKEGNSSSQTSPFKSEDNHQFSSPLNSTKASSNDQWIDLYYNSQIGWSQISPLIDQSNYQQILLFIKFLRHHFVF